MKHKLPRFPALMLLLLAAVCWQPGSLAREDLREEGDPQSAKLEAERMISQARAELAGHDSVVAKLRQQVNLFGHRLIGSGVYLQHGSGPELLTRLELKIQVAGQVGSLLQVNDGRFIWTDQQMHTRRTTTRIDGRRALAAWHGDDDLSSQTTLVMSGLGELMAGVASNFEFTLAGQQQFGQQPVYVLHGAWRPARLAGLTGAKRNADGSWPEVDLSEAPEHAPHQVLLLLRRHDLFPCVIDFQRIVEAGQGSEGQVKSIVWMHFYDVDVNPPVDPRLFVYVPGDAEVIDNTSWFLSRLRYRASILK